MDILEAARVIARTNDQAIMQKAKEVAYAFDLQCLKESADEFEDLARVYGVMSIPTLVLLEKGKEVKRNIGFIDKNSLEEFLK